MKATSKLLRDMLLPRAHGHTFRSAMQSGAWPKVLFKEAEGRGGLVVLVLILEKKNKEPGISSGVSSTSVQACYWPLQMFYCIPLSTTYYGCWRSNSHLADGSVRGKFLLKCTFVWAMVQQRRVLKLLTTLHPEQNKVVWVTDAIIKFTSPKQGVSDPWARTLDTTKPCM